MWSWEQILNTTLGLGLPDRNLITNGRWTGIEANADIDPGLFLILSLQWQDNGSSPATAHVYLAPEFTAVSTSEQSQSPWLAFQAGPGQILSGLAPGALGLDAPGNSALQIDPSGFAPAVLALAEAADFYINAADTFSTVTTGLAGNANQFQGQAGGEFAQLMQDFYQQAFYAQGVIGYQAPPGGSYSGLVLQAGQTAGDFLSGISNAWAGWTKLLTHSPLGSILQALIDFGIVTGTTGNWTFNQNVNLENVSGVGDLRTDAAWQMIEARAKKNWQDLTLVPVLDASGRNLIMGLENGYYQAANKLAPLKAPAPAQIAGGIGSGGPNGGGVIPNGLFNNVFPNDLFNNLVPNGLFNNVFPNDLFNNLVPNGLFNNVFPNDLFNNLVPNGLSSDLNPNGLSGAGGGANGLSGSGPFYKSSGPGPNVDTISGAIPNQPAAAFGSMPAYGSAAGPSQAVAGADLGPGASGANQQGAQSGLQSALASGQIPPGLQQAPGGGGGAQSGLQQAPGGGGGAQGALQQALDTNAGTQDALQSALTSGQVPPGSALQKTLGAAQNSADQTQAALDQAAGAGGATNGALRSALADNAGTQAALSQALSSGQVPPGSPLANTLQAAQTNAERTGAALSQAVAAGPPPSAAQTTATRAALGDNSQTQHELSQALLSGQVPPNSPLHSTVQSALTDAGKTQGAISQALRSGTGTTTASLDQALKANQATQKALNTALASGQVPTSGPLRHDLNQAMADSNRTGAALHQALAQQGVLTEPNLKALTSAVGVPGVGPAIGTLGAHGTQLGGTPLLSASLPASAAAHVRPASSGAFAAPAAQAAAAHATQAAGTGGESPFPFYSPMAGGGMMGGQGQGLGQGQERERSTWLSEDEDVWGTDPEVGPQVLGRDDVNDEEPEEYDGHSERPARRRSTSRVPGRQQ